MKFGCHMISRESFVCLLAMFVLLVVVSKLFSGISFMKTLNIHKLQHNRTLFLHPANKKQKVYSFTNKWGTSNTCKPYSSFLKDDDFYLARYSSNAGNISIFIHHPYRDYVSRKIREDGAFDVHLINKMINELKNDLDLHLIDIGTNVGQFCLATALLGRRCIAIDAAESNIQHVCASADLHNFESKITLIQNALSDQHDETVPIQMNGKGDFGAIFVDVDNVRDLKRQSNAFKHNNDISLRVNTVKLDDLLDLPEISQFVKVFIKMDVEGFEHRALLGAREFFVQKDVRGIIMEWKWHVGRKSSGTIKQVLTEFGFVPCDLNNNLLELDKSDFWEHDLIWYPFSQRSDLLD